MVVGIILIGIVAGSISAVVTLITGAGFLAALLAYSGVGAGAVAAASALGAPAPAQARSLGIGS